MDRKSVIELLNLLDVSDDEAIKALLSVFASVQPGPIAAAWKKRADYGVAPTTKMIWELFTNSNFRCSICGSHSTLTIDHENRDTQDVRPENLRVMCHSCNRASGNRMVHNKDAGLRIYKAIMELYQKTGVFPSDLEVQRAAGVSQLSGARYMVRFFHSKLHPSTFKKAKSLPIQRSGTREGNMVC